MKTMVRLLFSVLFLIIVVSAKPKDYTGYRLVEVVPKTLPQLVYLNTLHENLDVDFWKEPLNTDDKVVFSVSPKAYDDLRTELQKTKLKPLVAVENLQENISLERKLNDLQKDTDFNPFKYNRYDDINRYLEGLAKKYDFCDIRSIGKSHEGRDMKILKIGNNNATRSIVLDGGIHAREWISPAVCIYIINKLVEVYSNPKDTWKLKDKVNWYIIPVLNPDGYEYSHEEERLWRKTRTTQDGFCYGVDANRNFDFHWMEGGASSNPCSNTYAGPRPFSEIEAVNIKNFIEKTSNVDVYIPIHAYGQLWLIPWGYTRELPADYDDLKDKADAGAAAIRATSGKVYKVGQTTRTLYVASGGADDWAKGKAGVKYAYTIELRDKGNYGFLLPPSEIEPTGSEIWAGLRAMADGIYKD